MLTVNEQLIVNLTGNETVSPVPLADGTAKCLVKVLRCMAHTSKLSSSCTFTHDVDATPEQFLANPTAYCSSDVTNFLECCLGLMQADVWTYTVSTSSEINAVTGDLRMIHRVDVTVFDNP